MPSVKVDYQAHARRDHPDYDFSPRPRDLDLDMIRVELAAVVMG